MDLAGPDRQRAGSVKNADFAGQLVMRAQVAMELRAMALLDHQDAAGAVERAGESFGPDGGQQSRRDEPRGNAVGTRVRKRLAHRPGQRAPSDYREVAVALDLR